MNIPKIMPRLKSFRFPREIQRTCIEGATCVSTGIGGRAYCYKEKTDFDRCANSNDPTRSIEGLSDLPQDAVCSEGADVKKCQAGLVCVESGFASTGYCFKKCGGDKDCPAGQSCTGKGNNQACQSDKVPFKGRCQQPKADAPGSASCPKGFECKPCTQGHTCVTSGPQGEGYCERNCTSNAECRGGDSCVDLPTGNGKVCYPEGILIGRQCKGTSSVVNTCQIGLTCVNNGIEGRGFCYKTCSENINCSGEEICYNPGTAQNPLPSICVVPKKEGEACSSTTRQVCDPDVQDAQGNRA
ncbi:MAG: hypothetical protein AAGJ35_16385, partial [Myxococcota bacterium]